MGWGGLRNGRVRAVLACLPAVDGVVEPDRAEDAWPHEVELEGDAPGPSGAQARARVSGPALRGSTLHGSTQASMHRLVHALGRAEP